MKDIKLAGVDSFIDGIAKKFGRFLGPNLVKTVTTQIIFPIVKVTIPRNENFDVAAASGNYKGGIGQGIEKTLQASFVAQYDRLAVFILGKDAPQKKDR